MADLEERPSKIRKLEPSKSPTDSVTDFLTVFKQAEQNGPGPEDCQPAAKHDEKNEETTASVPEQNEEQPQPSKRQLKKLRKAALWEAGKDLRKAKKREKHKEKKARKAEERAAQQACSVDLHAVEQPATDKDSKRSHRRPIQVPVTFVLDCDFDEYMTEKELISLGAQLTRCYSDNRSTPYRSHLVISSWNGNLRSRFETALANNHLGWKGVRFTEKDFVAATVELDEVMRGPSGGKSAGALLHTETGSTDIPATRHPTKSSEAIIPEPSLPQLPFEEHEEKRTDADPKFEGLLSQKSEPSVVYLTSDSPYTLDRLSPNTSYVIGGIVDKNRHKGLCYKRACERGISTAKLPIGEYMTMQSRTVLAVNHVVEIMLKWLETGDWGEAFLSVIPKRKEAKLKISQEKEKHDGREEDKEEDESSDEN